MTSRRAATRGSTFLPIVVAGAIDDVIATGERNDEVRGRLGEALPELRRVGEKHLAHAGELRGGVGGGPWRPCRRRGMSTSPPILAAAQRLGRLVGQGCVVVVGEKQNCHLSILLFQTLRGCLRP
jgi:hypothetical protein